MIYTPLTKKAMEIAYWAHHGQCDKAGVPYIYHPIHLAEQMNDETTACIALLHDVVEDTPVTFEDLAKDFPKSVIDALLLLTHAPNTNYFDYIHAICSNANAATVKRADLLHNSDETRLTGIDIPEKKRDELRAKYAKALAILDSVNG